MPAQRFGGINTRDAPYDLPANESQDLQNVRFLDNLDDETLTQRKGAKSIKAGATATVTTPTNAIVTAAGDLIVGGDDIYMAGGTDTVTGFADYVKKYDNTTGQSMEWDFVNAFGSTWCMPITNNPTTRPPAQKLADSSGTASAWAGTPPNKCQGMVFWRGRIVVLEQDTLASNGPFRRLRYSDAGNPESPTSGNWGNNFIDIYDQEDSSNTQLVVHNNNLYLFKENSLWMIYDPNTFANRLICMYGTGKGPQESFPGGMTKAACSCPYDRRLYWYSPQDGAIHSSNGETDHVVESAKFLLPQSSIDEFPMICRMVYDPAQRSVLFFYPGPSSSYNDRCLEIVLRGKPGDHPLLYHVLPQQLATVITEDYQVDGTIGEFYAPQRVIGFPSTTKVYDVFGQTGSDDGTAISSRYQSAWAPFISEEPMERIRRVNMLYRGVPIIDIISVPLPSVAATIAQTLTPAEFVGASRSDRTYLSSRGPNKKGRYHSFIIRNGVLGKDFEVSALEFVIRGGKEKK